VEIACVAQTPGSKLQCLPEELKKTRRHYPVLAVVPGFARVYKVEKCCSTQFSCCTDVQIRHRRRNVFKSTVHDLSTWLEFWAGGIILT
jgi:hypothetical protein